MSSWITPRTIRAVVSRLQTDPEYASRRQSLTIPLPGLTEDRATGVATVVNDWLADFELDLEVVLLAVRDGGAVGQPVVDWINSLPPRLQWGFREAKTPDGTECLGLAILGPDAFLDLILPAVNAFAGIVARKTKYWTDLIAAAGGPERLFFVPANPGWYATWIEAIVVGELLGPESVRVGLRPAQASLEIGHRFLAVQVPCFPAEAKLIEAARQSAVIIAARA